MQLKPFTIFFLLLSGTLRAQDSSFTLLRTIREEITTFAADNLDNLYLVNNDGRIKKLNAAGDSVAVFNDVKRYGPLYSIDVSNPLKVLLYYKDFGTVVVLDRFLNIRNIIDLRKRNMPQVKAVAQSYDNKIWLYDELDNKLKKIDEDGSLLNETPDFRQIFSKAPSPQYIYDQEGYVYLYDPQSGAYIFDYYGALKNNLPLAGWKDFKVMGKYMYGVENDTLHRYQISTLNLAEQRMPEQLKNTQLFNFTATRLYALKKDGLEIYTLH